MSTAVSAAGALLWMTHTLLEEHGWVSHDLKRDTSHFHVVLESFAGDVNLLPAQCYQLPKMGKEDVDVHVRALLVANKLFVHFVVTDKSIRLSLKISEFVKPRGLQTQQDEGQVLYTDQWRCNLEILGWRFERNLFPEFSSKTSAVPSDAELSRLPEPLLVRIEGFLTVSEFCRVTQTCKYLHLLNDSTELWQQLLLRDYRVLQSGGNPKGQYILRWNYEKRMETWNRRVRERRFRGYMLRRQAYWHWQRGRRLPTPPLHLPMPPPFVPLSDDSWSMLPPHRPDLFGDDDLELPFASCLDPLYPYFY